ncbi:hypothetical protein LINPERHAP2_LOCUS4911 [Linum perenne]
MATVRSALRACIILHFTQQGELSHVCGPLLLQGDILHGLLLHYQTAERSRDVGAVKWPRTEGPRPAITQTWSQAEEKKVGGI